MCKPEAASNGTEYMAEDTDVQRLHERIDEVFEKFEKSSKAVADKLTELHTDVKVIKEASKRRDASCVAHNERTDKLDVSLRGNGKDGALARLTVVEQRGSGKEKFAYLVIGALTSGLFALGIALVIKLSS